MICGTIPTLIEKDDPYLDFFESAAMEGLCKLTVMDKLGAEVVLELCMITLMMFYLKQMGVDVR